MPIVEFKYMGQSFRVVGTRRTEKGWEHSVKCLETGIYKWKTDEWLFRIILN